MAICAVLLFFIFFYFRLLIFGFQFCIARFLVYKGFGYVKEVDICIPVIRRVLIFMVQRYIIFFIYIRVV